ncbi:NAD(P)H-hydrate dehydratase [Gaopeijia maritima]|uniref:NAD(P)H-hydrate dehydratase n=1 Tax=Gaopeijia maritima TaxID=3119007 RepID=UPI00324EB4C3
MPLRPWSRDAVPVATGSEAAAFDRAAVERGVPERSLMESAGRAAADLAMHLAPEGPVIVVAGAGHNGGDGVVAARTLAARGRSVRIVAVGARPDPDPLLHGWVVPVRRVDDPADWPADAIPGSAALVIDALLGTGLRGEPRPLQAAAIRAMVAAAEAGVPVLALDVPSGVVADTGACPGPSVRASATLCFGWPKLGALLEPGRARAGRVVAAEIGFPPSDDAFGACLLTPAWAARVRPRRDPVTHKNRVGAVTVVGGGEGMAGAVILAARAALRSGAGFVRIVSDEANREVAQTTLPDAPFVPLDRLDAVDDAIARSGAVVFGPGLGTGEGRETLVERVLAHDRPAVIDADALNLLAEGRPFDVESLIAPRAPRLLTPHPGEMARLLGVSVAEVEADRPDAARRLVARSGATVVLKGTPSLVASAGRPLGLSSLASSDLAVAGMGDVLAGSAGAFLAQGAPACDAAGLALLYGARAAHLTGLGAGLAASDVPEALPRALGEDAAPHTDLPFPWLTLDLDAPR